MAEGLDDFIGTGEEILSSLKGDNWGLFVTNRRLIDFTKTEDGKRRTLQDFSYKHISHIHCESTVGVNYRLLGIISIVLGLVIIWAGSGDYYSSVSSIVGIILIILGVIGILYDPKLQSVLKIDVVGISNPVTITLQVSASDMDLILKPLADMRRARR